MLKKTYRTYLRLKIYKQEKKIKKLWAYKHPNQLFIVGRRATKSHYRYWKGRHYRNGEMFTRHPHKGHKFKSYESARWALENSDLLWAGTHFHYDIIRLK